MKFENAEIKSIKEVTTANGNLYLEVLLEEVNVEYPSSLVGNVWGGENGERVEKFKQYNQVGDVGTAEINAKAKASSNADRIFNNLTIWRFDKNKSDSQF